jgi:hypothetical protein
MKVAGRRGIVVIASRTKDSEFEKRQGVMFLGIYTLQWCCQKSICVSWCEFEKNKIPLPTPTPLSVRTSHRATSNFGARASG